MPASGAVDRHGSVARLDILHRSLTVAVVSVGRCEYNMCMYNMHMYMYMHMDMCMQPVP